MSTLLEFPSENALPSARTSRGSRVPKGGALRPALAGDVLILDDCIRPRQGSGLHILHHILIARMGGADANAVRVVGGSRPAGVVKREKEVGVRAVSHGEVLDRGVDRTARGVVLLRRRGRIYERRHR